MKSVTRTTKNLAAEFASASGIGVMAKVFGDDLTKALVWHRCALASDQQHCVNGSYRVRSESTHINLWTVGFKLGLST